MWNLRSKTNKQREKNEREKNREQTLNYREQIDGCQRGGDVGMD